MKYILVTGSNGMIGKYVVKALLEAGYHVLGIAYHSLATIQHPNYSYKSLDMTQCLALEQLLEQYEISHIIHLAAIAHTIRSEEQDWNLYYRMNTLITKTVARYSEKIKAFLFFTSSIDIYGLTNSEVTEKTMPQPITFYAYSKLLAEKAIKEYATYYTIARLAPVYSEENQKDIRKRYYIRYPHIGYCIGNGMNYDFLSVEQLVHVILLWCQNPQDYQGIMNLCDVQAMNTYRLLRKEKEKHALVTIPVPLYMANGIWSAISLIGKRNSKLTFSISKVLRPIKIRR